MDYPVHIDHMNFVRMKCISQEINHNNNRHHHSDSEPSPAKIINLESSTSADRTDSTNTFSSIYTTKNKEHYKLVLESIYSVIAGLSSLHNITDTQPLLNDIKSRLNNLKQIQ